MKKSIFILLLLLPYWIGTPLQAQDAPLSAQRPTLKVNGTAHIRVAPDQAVINMTVKSVDMDINQAVKQLEAKSGKLSEKLRAAGFRREEIKTSQLSVQENGRWRNGEYIDSGYVAQQFIELKFKRDQQRITRLLEAFAQEDGADAMFQFGFALSDDARQQAYEELIGKAVADARSKASVIAKASGVKLGKVRSIVYGQPDFRPVPMQYEMMDMKARGVEEQSFTEMEAQEIELNDSITVYWDLD